MTHTLYIFGGQRNKEHQADLLAVYVGDIDSASGDTRVNVKAVCTAAPPRRAPPTGFTQRATIDPDMNEIYVLSVSVSILECILNFTEMFKQRTYYYSQGLSKEKDKRISNSLWVYSITNSQWSCIYKNDNFKYWSKMPVTEPCPRLVFFIVYVITIFNVPVLVCCFV